MEDSVGYSNESIWASEMKNHFGNANEIKASMTKHTHTHNYSLKTVKQGYYAFSLKQWLCLHHEGNLLTCLNKRNYLPLHINICSVFVQYVIQ